MNRFNNIIQDSLKAVNKGEDESTLSVRREIESRVRQSRMGLGPPAQADFETVSQNQSDASDAACQGLGATQDYEKGRKRDRLSHFSSVVKNALKYANK